MKTIKVIVQKAGENNFDAYCEDEPFSGKGETALKAVRSIRAGIVFFKQIAEEDGFEYPEYLNKPFKLKTVRRENY